MQNRSQLFSGGVLIALGVLFLLSSMLNINLWQFVFPSLFILVGLWIITQNRSRDPEIPRRDKLIGEVNLVVDGQPHNEDMWVGVGDIDIDLSRAAFPAGVTTYRVSGFVGDVKLLVPAGIGVRVRASNVVSDIKLGTQKDETVFSSTELVTPNYASAERRLDVMTNLFVGDINVQLAGGV